MQFSEGQTVIHPHHGPATVTKIVERRVRDRVLHYVYLTVHGTELEVAIPLETADEIGLRAVCGREQITALLEVLAAPSDQEEQQWSRRMKANHERLRTGELLIVASLIRDMTRRSEEHGLSAGERDLLKLARRPVLAEIALSLGLSEEDATELLESAVEGRTSMSVAV